jgi:peroxiredoxin Q/BCP
VSVGVGDPAPDFTLPGVQGTQRRDYTLSDLRGKKVVLAFYPGDFTAGCTKQLCSYRDEFEDFEGVDAVVLGISPQDVDSHERWIAEKGFQFPLLADPDKLAIKAYDLEAPIIGVRRAIFLVDAEGIIRYRYTGTIRAIFKKPRELAEILQAM